MGEVEINKSAKQLIIHSVIFFYGNAANAELSKVIADDIGDHWNAPGATVPIRNDIYSVYFNIHGEWASSLTPEMVFENDNPGNNYFRIEEYAYGNISFVDGLGCNTGYFKLDNLLQHSTTAAHEYGHTLGLDHPKILDIRGCGIPGIMYPRGTIVDPQFQYNPAAAPLEPGGTINPLARKVLQQDIDNLKLHRLRFNQHGFAVLGEFSSVWHDAHERQ